MEDEISQERLDRAEARLLSRYPDRDVAENATMSGSGMIYTPFTPEQVEAFNKAQSNPQFHGYTCGKCNPARLLHATKTGLKCCWCGWDQQWMIGGNDGQLVI